MSTLKESQTHLNFRPGEKNLVYTNEQQMHIFYKGYVRISFLCQLLWKDVQLCNKNILVLLLCADGN